jgi:hypothetical protein
MDGELRQFLMTSISAGIPLASLKGPRDRLKTRLSSFIDKGFSCFLLLTGHPGSGKTYTIRHVLSSITLADCWCHTIDCRAFDTDRDACKEFMRFHGQPLSAPIHEVLASRGTGILIFDHFESLRVVKRQFFLYSLFDSVHTSSVQLCVILVTSSHEPLNNLEKRVRSRFSPTCIDFPPPRADASFVAQLLCPDGCPDDWKTDAVAGADMATLFEIAPSLHTGALLARKLVLGLPDGGVLTGNYVRETVALLMGEIGPARFIAGMSQMELLVLLMCDFLVKVKNYSEMSFDMVYAETMTQLNKMQFVKKLTADRGMLAWQKAVALRLLVHQGKDPTKVALAVFDDDVVAAIDRLPTEIQTWARTWR